MSVYCGGGGGGLFFRAEDGIRDYDVTGVQTCALPISLQKLSFSDTDITVESVTSLPAMGSKSGVIHVDAANDYYIGATNGKQFVLPLGLPVFIELNYASNIEFSIGAIKKTTQGDESLPPFFKIGRAHV